MAGLSASPRSALLLAGPEGGFLGEEIELMKSHYFIFASLGPRRLRAETAGIALLSSYMMSVERLPHSRR